MTQPPEDESFPSVFVEHMYWLVVEEAWLCEVPEGVTAVGPGVQTRHGPWEPAECSRQLLEWFDAGLIELYTHPREDPDSWFTDPGPRTPEEWRVVNSPGYLPPVEPSAARELLAAPTRWDRDTKEGYTHLCRTDAGMSPHAAWW